MMKKIKVAVLALVMAVILPGNTVLAEASQTTTYTYTIVDTDAEDGNINWTRTQDAYIPERTITRMGLNAPADMYINEENVMYIADTGNKRIITYDIGQGPKVLINPVITKKSGKQTCEEGCLSSPNVFGMVDRPKQIIVEAFDIDGNKVKIKAEDLEAVVLCHEIDHLDGKLFLDVAYDMYTLTEEEIAQAKAESEAEYNKKNNKNSKSNKKNKNRK